MSDYTSYRFLYPPRPEQAIFKLQLPLFQARGFIAQYKRNGTGSIMAISPQRQVTAMKRTNEPHLLWSPSTHTADPFRRLPRGWYVFVTELLHSKVADAGLRDINYINDILVTNNQTLIGTTFSQRQEMLADLFKADRLPVAQTGGHYVIDKHTWLARNYTTGFAKLFDGLTRPEDEGLVLKLATAKLAPCIRPNSNSLWQSKVRRPTKNYAS